MILKCSLRSANICTISAESPKKIPHIDHRKNVKKALRTKSIDEAVPNRDALIKADNEFWATLALEAAQNGGITDVTLATEIHHYEAAVARVLSFGVSYVPVSELVALTCPYEVVHHLS